MEQLQHEMYSRLRHTSLTPWLDEHLRRDLGQLSVADGGKLLEGSANGRERHCESFEVGHYCMSGPILRCSRCRSCSQSTSGNLQRRRLIGINHVPV